MSVFSMSFRVINTQLVMLLLFELQYQNKGFGVFYFLLAVRPLLRYIFFINNHVSFSD